MPAAEKVRPLTILSVQLLGGRVTPEVPTTLKPATDAAGAIVGLLHPSLDCAGWAAAGWAVGSVLPNTPFQVWTSEDAAATMVGLSCFVNLSTDLLSFVLRRLSKFPLASDAFNV